MRHSTCILFVSDKTDMSEIIRTGDNIILRRMNIDDTDNIVRWRNSPIVMSHFIIRSPLTKEVHENWIKTKVETGLVEQFIITTKDSGKEIGSVYFKDIDQNTHTAEFGIFIGEESELGKGYGYEAQKLALDYAFTEMNMKTIILRVLSDNKAAIANYNKFGFSVMEDKSFVADIEGEEHTVIFMKLVGVN